MTLVLVDIENIKTADSIEKQQKTSKKFSFKEFHKRLDKILNDSVSYVAFLLKTDNNDKFIATLKVRGFYVYEKNSKNRKVNHLGYTYIDKDMDSLISFHMTKYGPMFDRIVLVSGDGDFYIPLKDLKLQDKEIWVISWKDNISGIYYTIADKILYIDDIMDFQKESKEKAVNQLLEIDKELRDKKQKGHIKKEYFLNKTFDVIKHLSFNEGIETLDEIEETELSTLIENNFKGGENE